jgi:hypothetical protein
MEGFLDWSNRFGRLAGPLHPRPRRSMPEALKYRNAGTFMNTGDLNY